MIIKDKVLGIRNTKTLDNGTNSHYLKYIPITDENYERCVTAITKIKQFKGDAQLYSVIDLNYREYIKAADYYRELPFEQLHLMLKTEVLTLSINRVLVNLLESMHMFLNHTEASIKRRYGKSSKNWKNYEKAKKDTHHELFSYRFLYLLRNYAHHCGLPLNSIDLTETLNPEAPDGVSWSVKFALDRDTALKNFDWRKITDELSRQPEKIEIDFHINLMMQAIRKIKITSMNDEMVDLKSEANFIDHLVKAAGFKETDDEIGVYIIDIELDEQGNLSNQLGSQGQTIPINLVRAILQDETEEILSKLIPYA